MAALPGGLGRPRVRVDSGFFDRSAAEAALANGADLAKRNPAAWRSMRAVPAGEWRPAKGMRWAEVASCDYVPGGRPLWLPARKLD